MPAHRRWSRLSGARTEQHGLGLPWKLWWSQNGLLYWSSPGNKCARRVHRQTERICQHWYTPSVANVLSYEVMHGTLVKTCQ